ncbi:MAG: urease accessory protein UreF [Nitrosopumilaceae archaeon]
MSTDKEFQMMQLSDSSFPSGMFSMSGGLESLFHNNIITNWKQVHEFIIEQIEFQLIPCDCSILTETMKAVKKNNLQQTINIDKKYYSMKLTKDTRNSLVRSGKQVFNCLMHVINESNTKINFLKQFKNKIESYETPCTYPVALAIYAQYLDISLASSMRILLYSFSSSVVSAAIRLGIIQHLDAQKILDLLSEQVNIFISKKINENVTSDVWQLTPFTEIYQMHHEHNDSRMFIT